MDDLDIEDIIEVRGRNTGPLVKHGTGSASDSKAKDYGKFAFATVLHGIGTGVIGLFIAVLIKTVEVLAFGSAEKDTGFLTLATNAPPWRRFSSVFIGGVFGAVAWYWLRGVDPAFVSVEASIKGERMPPIITLVNGMIQDICVALGGSFGREAAPREIAAMWGGSISDLIQVTDDERRILVACGTGAGLAAVYQVPISGVLYTIEHVLKWEMSLAVWIPAILTVVIATVVANPLVPDTGLYAMDLYSNRWPTWRMFIWAILIGPISGCAAVAFRRLVKFVETMKPLSRLPADWGHLHQGQWVRLKDGCRDESLSDATETPTEGKPTYRHATVESKDAAIVKVKFHDSGQERIFKGKRAWDNMNPEGRRDWRILIAMPSAFLVLAILTPAFPSLLGNGRALAKVAIHQNRDSRLWIPLLLLKVVVTVSAIGAGAAGGTLTPSVAMGSTIGIIVWEGYTKGAAAIAPHEYEAAAAISAAAFLAIGISSPVTAFALVMEFSAQAIRREDLIAALEGNLAPLIHSKFAIGMIVPMATAVVMAQLTNRAMTALYNKLKNCLQPVQKRRCSRQQARLQSRKSFNLDFPDAETHDEIFHLDKHTQNACFACFRAALLINTCLTMAVASAVPGNHDLIFKVSLYGVVLAVTVCIGIWSCMCCRACRTRTVGSDNWSVLAGSAEESLNTSCRHVAFSTFLTMFCALMGAAVPVTPWAMQVAQKLTWHTQSVDWVVLLATTLAAIAASSYAAALHNADAELPSEANVGHYALVTALAAGAAGALGLAYGVFGQPEEHSAMLIS